MTCTGEHPSGGKRATLSTPRGTGGPGGSPALLQVLSGTLSAPAPVSVFETEVLFLVLYFLSRNCKEVVLNK